MPPWTLEESPLASALGMVSEVLAVTSGEGQSEFQLQEKTYLDTMWPHVVGHVCKRDENFSSGPVKISGPSDLDRSPLAVVLHVSQIDE